MRQDDRPFWQEVREELDPRKNVVGWAAAIIMLVVVCVFGGINDHPAEPAMAASMCYNSCPWFEPWIERCRKPHGERCWEEIQDEEERLHALVEEDNVEDDNGDDSHPGIQPA